MLTTPKKGAMMSLNKTPTTSGVLPMPRGRRRSPEPWVRQKVILPATLLARFSRFHWDPTHNKPEYGAISKVMTDLLTDYVNRLENPDAEKEKANA